MSASKAFLRGLVAAALLAVTVPLAVFLAGPILGASLVLCLFLLAAAAVALARSTAAPRMQRGRRLVADAVFVVAALGFACWLATPGLLGAALAAWGFGLLLSLRSLLPLPGVEGPSSDDAFEAARARACALLEEEP